MKTLMPSLTPKKFAVLIIAVVTAYTMCPVNGQTPTATKNYIEEVAVKVSGKTASSQLGGLPVESVNRDIIYIDGLGRVTQSVKWQQSPRKTDLVSLSVYDAYGRQTKTYLPYAEQSSSDGSFKTGALSNQLAYYGNSSWDSYVKKTTFPFEVSKIEFSDLNRLNERGFAGQDWQPVSGASNGHTLKYEYELNSSTDAVKLWTVNATGATSTSYPVAKLYKTITKDENWQPADLKAGSIEEYTDLNGRAILKRVWETNTKSLSTYYLYDNNGNLRYTLPPAVNENGTVPLSSFTESQPAFLNFIYGYRYDGRNRVIERKIPGKSEWEYLVYNRLDQVVFSQDGNLRASSQWLFFKYDVMGREVIKGVYAGGAQSRADLQSLVNNQTILGQRIWELRDNGNASGTSTGYTNDVLPKTSIVAYHLVTYYDDYTFFGNNSTYAPTLAVSTQLKGLSTGIRTAILGSSTSLLKVLYYDSEARLIEHVGDNHLAGKDRVVNSYSFAGDLLSSIKTHLALSATTTIATGNEFDHARRKYRTKMNINNQGEVILNQLTYNDIGQVRNKALHSTNNGASFLQQLDYGYNDRGWLAKINDPNSVSTAKVFGLELLFANNAQAYNGNVGGLGWQTMVPSGSGLMQAKQNFANTYDKLDRLQLAKYSSASVVDRFNEEISYDVMGNISTLNRKNNVSGYLNSLSYNYASAGQPGNRLSSVTDAGTAGQSNMYTYDLNGNQKTNSRLLITDIDYNVLDLPQTFSKSSTGEVLTLIYAADGTKLKKQFGSATTDYLDEIQYSNSSISFILTDEGRALPGTPYTYEYFIKDHLGSTRATIKNNGDIVQIQDYYAFGLEMDPGNSLSPTVPNDYKLGGKEKQHELALEQYDFGARFYDPVIGKWNGVDALAEQSQLISPYAYSNNSPLRFKDLEGNFSYDLSTAYNNVASQQLNKSRAYEMKQAIAWQNYYKFAPAGSDAANEYQDILYARSMTKNFMKNLYAQYGNSSGGGSELGVAGKVFGHLLVWFTPFGSIGALAKAGRDQNYAAGAAALLGLAGEFGAIASVGSKTSSLSRSLSSGGGRNIGGSTIGLGLDDDLAFHRGTGAITYKGAGWQQAGLTKVDWGRASIDNFYFKQSFMEAAQNAGAINFNVSSFNPSYVRPGITNFEFNYIINSPSLFQKTSFFQNGTSVFWNGTGFVR